jgi:ubiquinone/menaquinone biosynthesis C-methylase UbiE
MENISYKIWQLASQGCSLVTQIFGRLEIFCSQRAPISSEMLKAQHQAKVIRGTERHNMAAHPDEAYYGRQYWYWIEQALGELVGPTPLGKTPYILDLGCGQGRLTLPLAKWSKFRQSKVVGVDISAPALDFARQAAHQAELDNVVEYIEGDILGFVQKLPSSSCSIILCTEVLYMMQEYKKLLLEVNRILDMGGLFIVGFRSRYFNILHSLAERQWSSLPLLLNATEGFPWGPPTRFSWFNSQETIDILEKSSFTVHSCRGIGVCSGLEGDPLATIAQPSMLTLNEQEELMKVELNLAEEMANCGRYIMAVATKKENL